ncbi:hypothetical protein OAS06_02955 [Gammaproteobacteria bacterium]|nr:hypothetical protein [Gammaproteobacteria bacterium]
MIKYRWYIGVLILVVFAVASLSYSYSQSPLYEGEVNFRLGRVPNIEAITKVGSLTNIGKGVWRLFEKKDSTMVVSRGSVIESLTHSYGNQNTPEADEFVFRVQIEASDVVKVVVRGATPKKVQRLMERISVDLIAEHDAVVEKYLLVLESNKQAIQRLIDEMSKELEVGRESSGATNVDLSETISLGYALLWEKRAELVLEKERLNLWMLPPNAYSTTQLGEMIIQEEKVRPKVIEHLLAFVIVGLAVALAFPIGLGFFASLRKNQGG